MWFTRVSLRNPVFATMIMLAFLVLGGFALQRLQVDQFPKIDFPTVVVSTAYPGAAPEIVESEVTRKIEEGVNTIAGINALTSRSYEGQSVVIVEFQLHIDGRKAADDVREKVAALRASLRDEVEEPKVQRFDPSSRPIWSVAILPDAGQGDAPNAVELTNWAEQVFKKRLENVRDGARCGSSCSRPAWKPSASRPIRWSPRSSRRTRTCRSARCARSSASVWCRSRRARRDRSSSNA